jgi:hypothetical protein
MQRQEEDVIMESMEAIGFKSFLVALRDSDDKFISADEIMRQAARFLWWTRCKVDQAALTEAEKQAEASVERNSWAAALKWKPSLLLRWTKATASTHSPWILRYVQSLEQDRELKPSSIVIYLRQIIRYFHYVCSGHIEPLWRLDAQYGILAKQTFGALIALSKRRVKRSNWKRLDRRELVRR